MKTCFLYWMEILAALTLSPCGTLAVETAVAPVLEFDFTSSLYSVTNTGVGKFSGVLPKGMSDNFSGWSPAYATSQVMTEGGRRFLRVKTDTQDTGAQFAILCPGVLFPGRYRMIMTARTPCDPLPLGFRQHGSPYESFWNGEFMSATWKEQTFLISVPSASKQSFGIYLYPAFGVTDLASIRIFPARQEEFAELIRRPSTRVKQFFRHTRFPLGLPCGWNMSREPMRGSCTADTAEPAPDGIPVLKIQSDRWYEVFSEPFQTNEPEKPHTIMFAYRARGKWSATVLPGDSPWGKAEEIPPTAEWKTFRCRFTPSISTPSFCLKFSGNGTIRIDRLRVFAGKDEPTVAEDRRCLVSLTAGPGEISEETRIQFTDEPASVRWCVLGAPAGARLQTRIVDLYGCSNNPAFTPLAANAQAMQTGTFSYAVFSERPRGQFRIEAWAEVDGCRISEVEELVMTRVDRPVYWNRDAPDSPFGCHFLARKGTILTMKACGINWCRLHDAGTEYSGWWNLEKKKGEWTFEDAAIQRLRKHHINIFAQLGTAPAWATHYADLGYRNMGYFEKYLRPTNTVDFLNYVTNFVTRYKGDINEYFVWNEPWGRWWAEAADIAYYDKAKAGYDFGVLQRQVYSAIKSVNPTARLAGYNTTSGRTGSEWTRKVERANVFDACDILEYHFYTTGVRCRRPNQTPSSGEPFSFLRDKNPDLRGKPIYMSEGQGTSNGGAGTRPPMSGLYLHSVTDDPEPRETTIHLADTTCRYLVSLLSEGVKKVFLYTAHGYTSLAVKPSFLVLLGADGYAHPELSAHAHLARCLENKKFETLKPFGEHALAYMFSGGGASCTVYAGLTKEEILAFTGRKDLRVTDLFGNRPSEKSVLPGTLVYIEH